MLYCINRCLHSTRYIQLLQNVLHMNLDRTFRYIQIPRNHFITFTRANKAVRSSD